MFRAECQELLSYPESKWGHTGSSRWLSLCTSLRDYEAPCRCFAVNRKRKWELASAFQKSIRRSRCSLNQSSCCVQFGSKRKGLRVIGKTHNHMICQAVQSIAEKFRNGHTLSG
jgi:hypothetical protein